MKWTDPQVREAVVAMARECYSAAQLRAAIKARLGEDVTKDALRNAWQRWMDTSNLRPMSEFFGSEKSPFAKRLEQEVAAALEETKLADLLGNPNLEWRAEFAAGLIDETGPDKARAEAERARIEAERAARAASDFESLKPEDDVSIGNDGRIDREAAQQKRQEYSRSMGEFAQALHDSGGDADAIPEQLGGYIGLLSEQERRFGNRRLARSISLLAAHEQIHQRLFKEAAQRHFSDRIAPTGYAAQRTTRDPRRTLVAFFSDLHLGAMLSPLDNPEAFEDVEERRRLEYFLRQVLDYKPSKRDDTELMLVLAGDLIEGALDHDKRDGAPLVEQKLRFWHYFRIILALAAQQFPRVRVVCTPGNHGRDVARHPGRATSSKWDGHEWEMMYALSCMSSGLPNVTFELPYKAAVLTRLYDWRALITHGDTEVKVGHPLLKYKQNVEEIEHLSFDQVYGDNFQLFMAGHFHTALHLPGKIEQLWNGMLVPQNGHARTSGHRGPGGLWLFEATPRHLVGDARYIALGRTQDRDESLGGLITRFALG